MSGTKVTTDPLSNIPNAEKPGEVTSDSLAAESIKAGGGFASNPGGASAQPSAGSTLANQDTSNASVLEPASSAAVRSTADQEVNAAAEAANQPTSGEYKTAAGGYTGSGADTAPSYVHGSVDADSKPKGEGLKEGGFNADAPNASFSTDIGGKNDPGRLAEQKFANLNAGAGDSGEGATALSSDGQYDVLKDTSA